ncbi:MAG: YkgJ family cysteine cluster protein [Thermoproteota archaeon]|nr:MAG: YkgJ family cysteine cluster protein [Candidatus Korarchaeota archaeon]
MRCPPGCHLCCLNTRMPLTRGDVKRITSLGYDPGEFAVRDERGILRLRNVGGRCYFLRDGRCSIYESRPLGCRAYPVVWDPERGACVKDPECPGELEAGEFVEMCAMALRVVEELGLGPTPSAWRGGPPSRRRTPGRSRRAP